MSAEAPLRRLTGYRLQRATASAMLCYRDVFARFGLRRTTFSCLALIVESPGLRQGQLGEILSIERPNLVTIVEDLTSAGLIEKGTSATDKRAYSLTPTAKGREVFARAQQAVEALDGEMTEGLSAQEVEVLQAALAKVQSNATGWRKG